MPLKDREARRAYQRVYLARWRRVRRVVYWKSAKEARRRCRERLAAVVAEFRRHGCRLCFEDESCCLVAHHLDPSTKKFSIATAVGQMMAVERLREELAKCVCLCHNCHAKVHAGIVELPDWATQPL